MISYQGSPIGFVAAGALVVLTANLWSSLAVAVATRLAPVLLRRNLSKLLDEQRAKAVLTYVYAAIGISLVVVGLLRL